jgi:hypothetical protein
MVNHGRLIPDLEVAAHGQTGIGFPARLRVSHQSRRLNPNYRRNGKLQSCEPCRKGKLRCDHMMPACGRCTRRNKTDKCVYHPAPLTKTATIPTPEPSDCTSSIVASQDLNATTLSTLLFPPFDASSAIQSRVTRASSLPAQPSSNTPPRLDDFRRPLPNDQAFSESIDSQQVTEFISHSAILAENELSIGILPGAQGSEPPTSSQVPQTHVEKGALVLALLSDLPIFEKYIEKLFQFLRGIIVIEPMVKIWTSRLWSTWHKVLEAQKTDGLRLMSERLWENTTKPLSRLLDRHTKPRDFVENTTGDNLRWEVVGIIMTLVGILAQSLQDGDPIFCSHDEPPVDRSALALKAFHASDACVSFCKDFDIMNDLFLWLLYEYTILACSLHATGSHRNWQCSGYLNQALVTFGLHQEIQVDDHTPFFITEFRKRVFVCAYDNDKYSASFTGRPPRLTRQYCRIQLPLDLNDSQLMSDGFDLDNALANLDQDGWNQGGVLQRCTFARIFASNGLILEEILEISLGMLSSEEIVRRAADIENRARQLWENLPHFLKSDDCHPFDLKRAPIELLFLAYIRLADLGHHFLLQRTLIKKVGADSTKLLEVTNEMFKFVLGMINNREVFREFQMDFIQLLCMNGIPSAAVVAVELLRQEQDPTSSSAVTTPLPRSDTIQDLSVFVACLAGIKPNSGASHICDRGRRFLKKILDTILSPRHLSDVGGSADGSRTVDAASFSAPLYQTGSDGDFMRWLESTEWEQDSWLNFN